MDMILMLAMGKSSRSCTSTLFPTEGAETELVFTLRATVSDILAIFKIGIFGHKTDHCQKFQELHICSLPQGGWGWSEMTLPAPISEILPNFQT